MWLTRVNERIRRMSVWATAPRMPTSMVASAAHISTWSSAPPGNSSVCARMIAYTPTLVNSPANTAVTGAGAVGYESGHQVDSGNTAALMPKATSRTANHAVRVPADTLSSRTATSAMFHVPEAAYTNAMPNRNTSDDTIETMT